jgi:NADPH-dependent curcumin reductase CurA
MQYENCRYLSTGACVGQVIESKNIQFKVGDYVLSNFGWREYWISSSGRKLQD